MAVAAAYPFIEVRIDTSGLQPVAQRAPGVIAVVGKTPAGAPGGDAEANRPYVIETRDDAVARFAQVVNDTVAPTTLSESLELALQQDPRPSKIYGVRVDGDDYSAALGGLEAADDVTFVALANETDVGDEAAAGPPPTAATGLMALKEHVEAMSAEGQKRLGVAMIDSTIPKSASYVEDVVDGIEDLRSDSSRMVVIGARGSDADAATAAMAAIAGFPPHISIVLKRIRGITMPTEEQYSPSEIKGLSQAGVDVFLDPALIVGLGLHFAEGRTLTTDDSMLYIDIVRTLDDIDFRLKAGLIGSIGDARITKAGMTLVKARTEGILGPLKRSAIIDDFTIDIPALNILSLPESTWTPADRTIVEEARANRTVEMFVTVTYGPAVHRLRVTLAPKF